MAMIHRSMHMTFKAIEMDASTESAAKLQAEAANLSFKDKCIESIKQWQEKEQSGGDLGRKDINMTEIDKSLVSECIQDEYRKIVSK